jgi:hypothetical protein
MSNVLSVVKSRNAKSEFKMLIVLSFFFVALTFFAIGFMYAQMTGVGFLVNSLVVIAVVNIAMVLYLFKKFNDLPQA